MDNKWIGLPLLALLALTACNDDGQADRKSSGPGRGGSYVSTARAQEPGTADRVAEMTGQARAFADAGSAPSDEAATGLGDRFFDGATLRRAGFSVPDQSGAVYAGGAGGARPRLAYSKTNPRASKDLSTTAPPLPEGADYPGASASESRGAGKVLAAFDAFQHQMYAQAAPIMSRAGWGAASRKGSPVAMTPTRVTVHHTEGAQTQSESATASAVRGIQHYHMAGRAAEGKDVWEDIGYHFLIDGSGRVIEGRPAETLGAHARSANANNIGIALMGDFNKVQPSAAQVESLTRLVSFLAIKYRQEPSRPGFLEGHRHYDSTDCPGKNLMAILDSLRQRIDAQTTQLVARLDGAKKGEFVPLLTDA